MVAPIMRIAGTHRKGGADRGVERIGQRVGGKSGGVLNSVAV